MTTELGVIVADSTASSWLGLSLFDVAGTTLTPYILIRTGVIIAITLLLVRLVRRAILNAQADEPQMTKSGVWLLAKLAKWGIIVLGSFFAMSSLGLNLTKATLIMSALTVGIGFGLQNIVNNFVSGIILMFERSVRVGDWIVVGSTEGTVQQMNIRSTIVTTFDHAEVIVPNSDLISSHVTNWTLLNMTGRIVIEFEVPPGIAPETLSEIVLPVAERHPLVCKGPTPSGPIVRVVDVGLRGLRYRLQCFVAQIGSRGAVRADLIAGVDAALSSHGAGFAFAPSAQEFVDQGKAPG